jgi:hypothetical protein
MPRVKFIRACSIIDCAVDHYAKGFCKQHYMAANREKFNPSKNPNKPAAPEFDYEDFWQFVKKELKIG